MSDNNIDFVPLALSEVSFVSLTGGDSPTPPTPVKPSEAILAAMPTAMREALVCWYQPKVQLADDDMTVDEYNELLNDNYPTYTGGLRDLSGNGYDMTLYGFQGEEPAGYVNDDGELCFDGRDDYARTHAGLTIPDFTMFFEVGQYSTNSQSTLLRVSQFSAANNASMHIGIGRVGYNPTIMGSVNNIDVDRSIVLTPTSYNGMPIISGAREQTSSDELILSKFTTRFTKFIYICNLIFDRTLTDTEIDWVKTNIINYNNN